MKKKEENKSEPLVSVYDVVRALQKVQNDHTRPNSAEWYVLNRAMRVVGEILPRGFS